MLTTSDIIDYKTFGFDGEKYIQMQRDAILERISGFSGKLYLEIGGKFLHDPHAARVLPGFFPDSKKRIFSSLQGKSDIIFCINAIDLVQNRPLTSEDTSYSSYVEMMLENIASEIGTIPKVAINRVNNENNIETQKYKDKLQRLGYKAYLRYDIEGYPENTEKVLSSAGYFRDDYIETEHDIVLVTGAASSSWKMSTCLGQIYHDFERWIESGYAKYETFPIWNLDLHHPVNLAYEAATADIGDYNEYDHYHETSYWKKSVNYNRDVEAFEIVMQLAEKFLPESNPTRSYKSPTDMGISTAGFCITDDSIVREASLEEIKRRKAWYQEMVDRWQGDEKWVKVCDELLKKNNSC